MLYPPIINFAMPAFNCKDPIKIYFAISTYNSLSEIAQAQVTVRYQTNNANALNATKYPNKIKCCPITEVTPEDDATRAATAARFFITLDPGDIATGNFDPTMIYKVQIRFSTKSWSSTDPISNLASSASEWSTVCLIKPIEIPDFTIVELEQEEGASSDETVSTILATLEPDFIGVYIPVSQSETLKNWRMRLYDSTGENLLADTGVKISNSYEANNGRLSFEGHLPYQMTNNTNYQLVFDIETKNGYTASKTYIFTAMSYATGAIDGTLSLSIDEEDGFARVKLLGNGSIVHMNVTLRRTSSKSNFTIWEDIANKTFENTTLEWQFDDFSIESGVFYQYGAQSRDNRGRRSAMIKTTQEMGQFDDAFLTEHGESLQDAIQLKIRYDMNISNSMVNIGQAKTDTIGSKYPFIRRNGNMYYHSFPFSFLITAYTDNRHIFATESQLKDYQDDLYAIARGSHVLSVYSGQYDYIYQRQFREKVETFLYNNKVKLFRSLTQGNMLIKLMNITLTPKQELGRLLYSVDATAVEIDEVTVERLDYYGIQNVGTYNPNITFNEAKLGQLNRIRTEWNGDNLETIQESYPANFNIMGDSQTEGYIPTIKTMYHYGEDINNVIVSDLYLSYLRIEIDSEPYLIKNVNGVLTPFDDIDPTTDIVDDETLLGTLININGTTILIEYPNNIYEIKGDNVRIGSNWNITPLKETKMMIDMVANLSQNVSNARTASTLVYKTVNGQLFGTFNSRDSLRTKIWYKYYLDLFGSTNVAKPYYIKVNVLYNLNIESEPGVVFYAQSNVDNKLRRFVIDETGELFVDPDQDQGYIAEAYMYGRNIEARWLHDKGGTEPDHPFQLDSYTDASTGNTYIYYNGQWRVGTPQDNGTSYDIACPVDAIVNYYIQTEKGYY